MNKIKKVFITTILITLSFSLFAAGDNWELSLEKNDIKVYTRPVEGSSMDEFMGVTVINAPIETCAAVLRDVPAQPQWMGDCLKARVLKVINKDRLVAYNVLNGTWPLSDRDLQIDTSFDENYKNGKVVVSMKVYPETLVPVNKSYVRVTDFAAKCILEKIDDSKTKVTYINRINPMAPVPAAIANRVVRKNPYNTLKGMKKMVKLQKYQK